MKKHKWLSFGKASDSAGRFDNVVSYDPDRQVAVVRSSICTGEKVAGFKSREDGHFTEVMLIRSPEDMRKFKEMYDLDQVKTEY